MRSAPPCCKPGDDGHECCNNAAENANPAGGPGFGHGRHGHQNCGQSAKRGKPHRADIEQSGIAPLDIHTQRHDGRDHAHIEQRQRHIPALRKANQREKRGHKAEHEQVSFRAGHRVFPLNMPVGFTRRTITRMTKDTANL